MATGKTLARGDGVTLEGKRVILRIADPFSARFILEVQVPERILRHWTDELRRALLADDGKNYNAILSVWYSLVKRATAQ